MLELLTALFVAWLASDSNGKVDPHKAAGIAWGMKGSMSNEDIADLGATLGAMGAFDDDNSDI